MKGSIILLVLLFSFPIVRSNPVKRRQSEGNEGTLPCCEDIETQTRCVNGALWKVFMGFFIIFSLLLLVILLGCIKGVLGLCYPFVGAWGLGLIACQQQPLVCCYETQNWHHLVICDCHDSSQPNDKDHTVHIYNRTTEFCLNIIFFFAYPIALCCKCCKQHEKKDNKGLCIPGCNPEKCYGSQLEEEDVRFVLEQLKLSRDSLRNCTSDAAEQDPLLTDMNDKSIRNNDTQAFGNTSFVDEEYAHQKPKGEMGQYSLGSEDYLPSQSDLSNDVDQYELLEQQQM